MTRVFDLHCDTPSVCFKEKIYFENEISAVKERDLKNFDSAVQVCAIFTRDDKKNAFQHYKDNVNYFKECITLPINDLTAQHSILLSVEGGSIFQGDPDKVFDIYEDGIRTVSLTWNGENDLAGGVLTDVGLKEKGKELIKNLNGLNMALDLSHLSDKSFFAAIELADFPLATHSNSRVICDNKRNLTDEQLKLIRDKKGIVGLNFYPPFLNDNNVMYQIYLNIEHMLNLGLENNIAIGSDFDGGQMACELDCTAKIPDLYDFLFKMDMDKKVLDKIFYENALGFYKKLFDNNLNIV